MIDRCTRGTGCPSLIYQLLPLTFDERYPIDAGYPRREGIPACVFFRASLEFAAGGRARLIPLLIDALRHPDWQIRNAAAARLWGYSEVPPEAATVLAGCLHDSNEMVRLSAAVAIRRFPEYRREALTNLLAAIASPTLSTPLRLHGIRMLHPWHIDAREFPDATNVLEAATKDKDNEIRRFAAQTLVDIAKRTETGESPKSDASH